MARASVEAKHTCGRCEQSFGSRKDLSRHLRNHEDAKPAQHQCPMCTFHFIDSLQLEEHRLLNNHLEPGQYKCGRCPEVFDTHRGYARHRAHGKPCCDALHSRDWKKSPHPGNIDPDKPKGFGEVQELEYGEGSPGTPSEVSEGQEYCHHCKKTFLSAFAYDCHILGCSAPNMKVLPDASPEVLYPTKQKQNLPLTPPTAQHHTRTLKVPEQIPTALAAHPVSVTLNTRAPVSRQPPTVPSDLQAASSAKPVQPQPPAPPQATGTPSAEAKKYVCNIGDCTRSYASEVGFNMHKTDTHGAKGLLGAPSGPRNGGGSGRGGRHAPAPTVSHTPVSYALTQRVAPSQGFHHQVAHHGSASAPPHLPTSQNIGGALEMEQAKIIYGKTMRLLLQTDVFIHHNGKMSVGGIDWTRISVDRQPAVTGMFNEMCHLPLMLQSLEYVPAPKTFAIEYTAQYPVADFESAPARNPAKPALDIIAISCSKITLANGCHDVVKIAAVDVLTCRVLISHLVCTDSSAQVANWHSATTGLSSFQDLEGARQAGYKVFKGWAAARSAIFKFVDQETIIVGHNLRAELDALRIIHGRAVDIAKVVEKAAKGPLSKVQVSLDSWCRDVANVARLTTDPVFGRDCIMNAFAAREIGLWIIKNKDRFEHVAKQKTRDYQSVGNK